MADAQIELLLSDSSATAALGAALARGYLHTGRRGAVLYLRGELGAGKTTCVRGVLHAFGVEGLIRSPTYTLVEAYELQDFTCVHVDLYRLQGRVAVEELGLRDYLYGDCLMLIEWPEKGETALPLADVELLLRYLDDSRVARLTAPSVAGKHWMENLANDKSLTPYLFNLT